MNQRIDLAAILDKGQIEQLATQVAESQVQDMIRDYIQDQLFEVVDEVVAPFSRGKPNKGAAHKRFTERVNELIVEALNDPENIKEVQKVAMERLLEY